MKQQNDKAKNIFVLTPIAGTLIFVLLYVVATFYYPGGSNANKATLGFDWLNNYWCDLTGQFAKNGEVNSARPIALTAMLILCSTLAVFWFYVPRLFSDNKFNQIIRYAGIASMTVGGFLFTDFHDTVINVAGTLGIVAMTGVFIGLYRNNLTKLFGYGVFCLGIMLFNYFVYETSFLLSFLPIIQKATFVLLLVWICLIDIYLYRTTKAGTVNEQLLQIRKLKIK
jgi:hypothetical protein